MADNTILNRLDGLKLKYEETGQKLTDPEVIADVKQFIQLTKEYKELEPIIETSERYRTAIANLAEAKDTLATDKDEEMREMAREMIAELEARSDHTFTLKEGTLYPILHTLEKDGAVKSYEKEAPTGRMRKYYRITRKGLRLLDEKKEEWVEFTHTVNAILAGTSPALA